MLGGLLDFGAVGAVRNAGEDTVGVGDSAEALRVDVPVNVAELKKANYGLPIFHGWFAELLVVHANRRGRYRPPLPCRLFRLVVRIDNESPLNVALALRVLVVVLWRELSTLFCD